jgi:hypothetical protein
MFLHIGGDVVIHEKNIIAILDIESTTISKDSKKFLKKAEEEGIICSLSNDLPKTFILTDKGNECKIYLSPISTLTLQKRIVNTSKINNKNYTF